MSKPINVVQKYVIAIYMRLSSADRDKGENSKDESDSITAQRAMLWDYVASRCEFAGADVIEFCDDGQTGTNFDRTGVSAMLEAAKRGTINCIIVKDLSRFGRDYIEVGDYLEQIFPFLGIRFIAVNDNYDSAEHPYGSAGLIDVSFKNVIYDLYSKELSQKVKSTKRQLASKGYFMSPYAFYGYEKAPKNRHTLMIEESAAVYVREIFRRAMNGESTVEIARDFNLRGIPTPMMAKRAKNVTRQWNSKEHDSNIWTRSILRKILSDERYTGSMIYGKMKRVKVGSPEVAGAPKEEWTVIPDMFPAIISKEVYQAVQSLISRPGNANPRKVTTSNLLFHRKIQCGYCKLSMTRQSAKKSYYVCNTYKENPESCCPDERIYESELADVVLTAIRKQAQLFCKAEKEAQRGQAVNEKKVRCAQEKTDDLKSVIGMKTQEKMQAFEDMVSERITQRAYQSKCERCDAYYSEPTSYDTGESGSETYSVPVQNNISSSVPSNYELSTPIESTEAVEHLNTNYLKSIRKTSDDSIDWTEVLVSPIAPDETYNQQIWDFYHNVAAKVLAGDIDTYLQLIYEINPLDDLLVYGSNYEFGTDDPKKIEVEFNMNGEALSETKRKLSNAEYNLLLQDYICSVCIRIARDMFALLPIKNTVVHAVLDGATVVSIDFDRQSLSKVKFEFIDPSNTLELFQHNVCFSENNGFSSVNNVE